MDEELVIQGSFPFKKWLERNNISIRPTMQLSCMTSITGGGVGGGGGGGGEV